MGRFDHVETPAMRRAEKVLARHGIPDVLVTQDGPQRSPVAINAIIRDVRAANAAADDQD